ncbi:MAG: citrate lyase subunit alpha [Desulfuromonas sp. SDB]|nr:MAG: citrate lyase subunit alpha [Desulfuromonas sp. SDB]
METITNSLQRIIPREANGKILKPYQGAFNNLGGGNRAAPPIPVSRPARISKQTKLCKDIREAIEKSGLANGDTISFHHHLRNGDAVVNLVMNEIAAMGFKDLILAPSALFPVHQPLIELIEQGVIRRIEGSMNGPIGKFVSLGGMLPDIPILRSHGGRARAIEDGDLHIDVAFIAAPTADDYGNAYGSLGKSACGPLAYSHIDSIYADQVVVITDNLVAYPCIPHSIPATHVDWVVNIDQIGDADKIVSGTTRITKSPTRLLIAKYAVEIIEKSGLLKPGFSFQTGAGGISLAVTKYLGELMAEKNITASFITGGITKYAVDLLHQGLVGSLFDVQVFDTASIQSLHEDPAHWETPVTYYANYHSKGCLVDRQDIGFLGATEVDIDFNVNVNTHSDGYLLHGIGGHLDVAAGVNLSMILIPSYRKRIPVIRDSVTTVTAPGETIDAIVTEQGISFNPSTEMGRILNENLKNSNLPVMSISELKRKVENITGIPQAPQLSDEIIALIEYRDGTIIDAVRKVIP